jgi:hypothetical protein
LLKNDAQKDLLAVHRMMAKAEYERFLGNDERYIEEAKKQHS